MNYKSKAYLVLLSPFDNSLARLLPTNAILFSLLDSNTSYELESIEGTPSLVTSSDVGFLFIKLSIIRGWNFDFSSCL